jgi:HPr kinase/phosphorylase
MPEKTHAKSEANIHATCVALGRRGILLLGPSGTGKSDLALRLIDQGAKLVADDRTILFVKGGALHAKAPASIRGLLEIRGVGIVSLPVCDSVKIVLAIRLGREGARLPHPHIYHVPQPLKPVHLPPQIALNARFASTPAKIRAALRAIATDSFRDTFHRK